MSPPQLLEKPGQWQRWFARMADGALAYNPTADYLRGFTESVADLSASNDARHALELYAQIPPPDAVDVVRKLRDALSMYQAGNMPQAFTRLATFVDAADRLRAEMTNYSRVGAGWVGQQAKQEYFAHEMLVNATETAATLGLSRGELLTWLVQNDPYNDGPNLKRMLRDVPGYTESNRGQPWSFADDLPDDLGRAVREISAETPQVEINENGLVLRRVL